MSRGKWAVLSLVLLLGPPCLILLPCAGPQIRETPFWVRSRGSLAQIGKALRNYYGVYGKLPAAVVRDKDGRPLYSWRVLLLPFLENENLYQQFKLNEPWDSPHNRLLSERTPICYEPLGGGTDAPGLTRYQVFVGPRTAFERDHLTLTRADFPDGLAETLLVVEAGEPVPWSKPADLEYRPDRPLPPLGGQFEKPTHCLCYTVGGVAGFNVAFADGTARFIPSSTDAQTLRALITRNGGEVVDLPPPD